MKQPRTVILALCIAWTATGLLADDWPQWRGPYRDGVSRETGLLSPWPPEGLRLLGQVRGAGLGYSSVAVLGTDLYTMGDLEIDGRRGQYAIAFDLADGRRRWITRIGEPHKDSFFGSRCTPTVDGDRLYTVGTSGNVTCLDRSSGRIVWQRHLERDLGGAGNITWRYSESPLVDGPRLLCTPGGRAATMVALDKLTGETMWTCSTPDLGPLGKDEAGYASMVVSEACGIRQAVQLTNKGLIGVEIETGRFLWGYNRLANRAASIPTPVVFEDYVFASNAYRVGSALLKIEEDGEGGLSAREVTFVDDSVFANQHGGFVKVGDFIYGGHGQMKGRPTCLEARTGKVRWQVDQPGEGSACVVAAQGHVLFRYEDGTLAWVAADPAGYRLDGLFKPADAPGMEGSAWAHPVIADGRLFLRHADLIQWYDLKAGP